MQYFVKFSTGSNWFWIRTQVGYFSVTRTGQLRKTNFSGGSPSAQFNQIDNNDGTISFKVHSGKFKDYFVALDGDRVGLDQTNKAHLMYDEQNLTLTYKDASSGLNDSQLYVNRNTGYFYFGFAELDYDEMERKRWSDPSGVEKFIITPEGWKKNNTEGYERCAVRFETQILERSSGLK